MRSKTLYITMALTLLVGLFFTAIVEAQSAFDIPWGMQQTYSNTPANKLKQWAERVDGTIQAYPPGDVWFVDGNRTVDTGDGKSWATAFKMLSTALAASHADIAVSADRQWASRNVIYVMADAITEDLTKLAQKTDVVGVGSYNQYKKAGIIGDHIIEAATSAHYMGCRIYNLQFRGDGGGILFDIPINQNGIEFINCDFQQNGGETIGLRLGGCHDTKVTGCTFRPNTSGVGFSTAAIQILEGAGTLTNVNITNNQIWTAGIGINWLETTTINCWITNNYIRSAGMGIDSNDEAGLMVFDNRILTPSLAAADNTSNDFNILYAGNNMVTGSGSTLYIPTFTDD